MAILISVSTLVIYFGRLYIHGEASIEDLLKQYLIASWVCAICGTLLYTNYFLKSLYMLPIRIKKKITITAIRSFLASVLNLSGAISNNRIVTTSPAIANRAETRLIMRPKFMLRKLYQRIKANSTKRGTNQVNLNVDNAILWC